MSSIIEDVAPSAPLTQPLSRKALLSGAALLSAGAGAWWLTQPPREVSTDAAYVQADTTVIAPRVRGFVSALMVADNQFVEQGQPLLRVDSEEYDARVAAARADLADARAQVDAARAALSRHAAEQRLADMQIVEAGAGISAARAQRRKAALDEGRATALLSSGAVSKQMVDAAQASLATASSELEKVKASLGVAQRNSAVVQSRQGDLRAALSSAVALVEQRQAALALAVQDQRHTVVRSPIAGVIGNRQVNVGDYVQAGKRVLSVIPTQAPYVTAYFKETQTGRMLVGQAATITVDALPGEVLEGEVDSLAPGSGSTFALLPFEPGTGNFTKIVQRVPVRIRLKRGQQIARKLRPGLSVTVTVDLGS